MKIGLDIGTSLTKAVLFDDDHAVLARQSAPTQLLRLGPGQFEVDLEALVESVFDLLAQIATQDVDLIALTGQGDGLWLLDQDGAAVRPALTWLDARGADVCDAWAATGVWHKVFERTHNAPFPGAGAALLVALDPILDDAATATQCQHAVFQRLTGVRTATPSCAMLPIFDPVAGDYDREAVRLVELEHRSDLLPPVFAAPVVAAPIRNDVADHLQLPKSLRVATGPYDLPAAALGLGPLNNGDGVVILGTTLACMVLQQTVDDMSEPVGLTLRTGDGSGFLRAMPAMVGTACLDWVLRLVGRTIGDLGRLLNESPPGARGVSALPFLAPSGERAPFADPAARAELTGLSLETTPADVVRAVCEALGYGARHCFDAAGLTGEVAICGGAAASAELVQLFADVLERPLMLSAMEEPAALGAVRAATGEPPARLQQHVVQPRPGQYRADGYADYLYRLDIARRQHWRRQRAG